MRSLGIKKFQKTKILKENIEEVIEKARKNVKKTKYD